MPRQVITQSSRDNPTRPPAPGSPYDLLHAEFLAFEALPADEASWKQRKETVRALERRVQAGAIALTGEQFVECRTGPLMLGRILARLMVTHHKIAGDLEERSNAVRDEWLRLQERQPGATISRMPMYYALEAYLAWLKENPDGRGKAAADSTLLQQIYDELDRRPDRDAKAKNLIREIQAIIAGANSGNSSTAEGTRFTAKLALVGVVITAAGTIGAAVLTNWDKLFGHKPAAAAAPSQVSSGAQSPIINGARDVTINNGTAAEPKPVSNVTGKWTTSIITNQAENSEHSRLVLEFVQAGGTLSGSVTESDVDGKNPDTKGLFEGKVNGNAVTFYTRGEAEPGHGSGDGPTPYKESYFGIVNGAGTEIAFSRVDDLPVGDAPEKFTAKRVH